MNISFKDLRINDVFTYAYYEDNNSYIGTYIALVERISDEGVLTVSDVAVISGEKTEENPDYNYEVDPISNRNDFIIIDILYNHKPIIEVVKENYPELFV